jgi:hypothetical protein
VGGKTYGISFSPVVAELFFILHPSQRTERDYEQVRFIGHGMLAYSSSSESQSRPLLPIVYEIHVQTGLLCDAWGRGPQGDLQVYDVSKS